MSCPTTRSPMAIRRSTTSIWSMPTAPSMFVKRDPQLVRLSRSPASTWRLNAASPAARFSRRTSEWPEPRGGGLDSTHQGMSGRWPWPTCSRSSRGGPDTKDSKLVRGLFTNVGAYIMGWKMFGGGDGPWNASWTGWWGDDPPYHVPVFVLTHHARNPLTMHGGTSFTFVTDGIESAL